MPYNGGFPDFSDWIEPGNSKKFDNLLGDTTEDFKRVREWIAEREQLGSTRKAEAWLKERGLTPHHLEDGRTMQLVPTKLHKDSQHLGGAALIRAFGAPGGK